MKEAIGGQWIFGIVALFIALFSGFLAYSISYTKAFKAKNQIVTLIEKNSGFTFSNTPLYMTESDTSVEAQSYYIVKKMGYNTKTTNCVFGENDYGSSQQGGYCLSRVCAKSGETPRIYYKVTTFVQITIPVIDYTFKIPISGETKAMYYEVDAATRVWESDQTTACFK
jgi:hypothetical protein